MVALLGCGEPDRDPPAGRTPRPAADAPTPLDTSVPPIILETINPPVVDTPDPQVSLVKPFDFGLGQQPSEEGK